MHHRIIEDMNHRFVLKVFTKDFKSSDFGVTANNRNKEHQTVTNTKEHVTLIKDYLKALDLIIDCPMEVGELGMEPEERTLFTRLKEECWRIYPFRKDESTWKELPCF